MYINTYRIPLMYNKTLLYVLYRTSAIKFIVNNIKNKQNNSNIQICIDSYNTVIKDDSAGMNVDRGVSSVSTLFKLKTVINDNYVYVGYCLTR